MFIGNNFFYYTINFLISKEMSVINNKIEHKIWLIIKLNLNNIKNYVDTP